METWRETRAGTKEPGQTGVSGTKGQAKKTLQPCTDRGLTDCDLARALGRLSHSFPAKSLGRQEIHARAIVHFAKH